MYGTSAVKGWTMVGFDRYYHSCCCGLSLAYGIGSRDSCHRSIIVTAFTYDWSITRSCPNLHRSITVTALTNERSITSTAFMNVSLTNENPINESSGQQLMKESFGVETF